MSAKAYVKVTSGLWKSVNKVYVKVTPTLWKSVNKIYVKVTSTLWKSSFGGTDEPVQITKPTLIGTGRVGTTLTRTSGTYSNYNSLITRIFYTTEVAEQVSGSTTDPSGGLTATNPYTVVQADATEPPYYFYARDEVVGVDNLTYYYYSTPPIEATVGTIEDNFNRTVASGLGTASSGFIYSGPSRNTSSWSVDGSRASNIYNGADYPLQTVTINSNNQNVSVDTFGGGLGVAVWVASANSWWAAIPTYTYQQGQGTDYTCTKNQSGTSAECEAVTYANSGENQQASGYVVSDVNKRCTICSTSTSSLYECTNNVRVTNAGDPCPPFENWSSAQPGGAGTVCSTACTESYQYICGSSFTLNQPDCTGELVRPDPTGEGQLCDCESYQETVAICPSNYNNSGPCNDSNFGEGTAIGSQCSICNVSTTYAYSYRNNSLTTTYPCTGSGTCSGKDCCKNWTIPGDIESAGVFCGNCNETPSTSTTYSYFTRASSGETVYSCNGSTITGSATCPTYRPDPTGAGQNCSGCTPSTSTTYGSCKLPGNNDPSGCVRAPSGYTSCAVGFVRCPSTTTTYSYKLSTSSTVYLCDVQNTGSGNCPTSLPATGSGPGQRCTACVESTSTTYSSTYSVTQSSSSYLCANFATGQSSCPGEGTGPGQRCGACTPTTTSLYKTRIAEVQTKYKTIRSIKLTYNNYKTRVLAGTTSSTTWKIVEETTADKFTYKSNIGIYSFSSGILTPKSTAVVSTYVAESGSQFNSIYYPTITRVAAVTTGDSINATGWSGSEFNVASSTNTGTKGTAVGIVGIPVTENIGTKLDNFSA